MSSFLSRFGLRLRVFMSGRGFAANMLTLGFGTTVGQALVVAVTPILSRLYGPAEMGQFGLFLAAIGPATVAASLRLDMAIMLPNDDAEADLLLLICIALLLPTAVASSSLLWILIVQGWIGFDGLPRWSVLAMLPLVIVTGLFVALRFWHARQKKFALLSLSLIEQGVGRAAVPVLLAQSVVGWVGLLSGEMAGRLLGVRRMLIEAVPALRRAARIATWNRVRSTLRRYIQFPVVLLPSAMLDAVAAVAATPVITAVFGMQLAGEFFLAYRLVLGPAGLLASSIADVYHGRFVEMSRTDPAVTRLLLGQGVVRLGVVGTVVYLPIAVLAPWTGQFVFGAEWTETGLAIAALTPAAIAGTIVNPLSRAITISRIPQLKLVVDVVRLVLPVGGIVVAGALGASFIQAIAAFSAMTVLGNCCYLAVIWYCIAPYRQRDLT